jgi:hypothetical protein
VTTPAPQSTDRMIWPVLSALRVCVGVELARIGRPVCRFPLVWGADRPPADDCDCRCADGGQGTAWGRWVTAAQTPSPAARADCSGGSWGVQAEFGVYRCYPVLDDDLAAPAEAVVDLATRGLLDDLAALRRAIRCCAYLADHDIGWSFVAAAPLEPRGGCAGAVVQIRFDRTECRCP